MLKNLSEFLRPLSSSIFLFSISNSSKFFKRSRLGISVASCNCTRSLTHPSSDSKRRLVVLRNIKSSLFYRQT